MKYWILFLVAMGCHPTEAYESTKDLMVCRSECEDHYDDCESECHSNDDHCLNYCHTLESMCDDSCRDLFIREMNL